MTMLLENVKDVEGKKRVLEEAVDNLNEQIAQQTANEKMQLATLKDKEEKHMKGMYEAQAVKEALESEMNNHHETHSKQVSTLRDEIQSQSDVIQELREINQKRGLEEIQIKEANEKLQEELNVLKAKCHDLENLNTKKEHAQKDLQGLEETVARELATLNKLRQMFVKDLQSRMKVVSEDNEVDEANSQAQKQKISFLENNLEQLTKVHKQLVRDNADLRLELPKLEKRLKATQERVKALEAALKDAKDGAMKDRSRYVKEVERWKQAYNKSQQNRRVHQPQIAKPIRPGQQGHGSHSGSTNNHNNEGNNSTPHSGNAIRGGGGGGGGSGNSDHQSGDNLEVCRHQGSVVIRAASPSKIPIVPMNSSQPIIKGYRGDGDNTSIGGVGVSQRVKSAVGVDVNIRNRLKKRSDEPKRSSMYVESSSSLVPNGQNLKSSSSMDKLNMIDNNSPSGIQSPRRLPVATSRSPAPQSLAGREAEIQALLLGGGGRIPRSSGNSARSNSQSPNTSQDGGPWERRNPSKSHSNR